jgi:hypothetical protein
MDQLKARLGTPIGDDGIGGQGIDDPGMAQPSMDRIDQPEAGSADGSFDRRDEYPAEGRADVPSSGDAGSDLAGTDNIREGRVGGVMGGPRQAQGEGQGG